MKRINYTLMNFHFIKISRIKEKNKSYFYFEINPLKNLTSSLLKSDTNLVIQIGSSDIRNIQFDENMDRKVIENLNKRIINKAA